MPRYWTNDRCPRRKCKGALLFDPYPHCNFNVRDCASCGERFYLA